MIIASRVKKLFELHRKIKFNESTHFETNDQRSCPLILRIFFIC